MCVVDSGGYVPTGSDAPQSSPQTRGRTRDVITTWVIAGASGVVGRYVVKRLLGAGVRLRLLSTSGRPGPGDNVQVIR